MKLEISNAGVHTKRVLVAAAAALIGFSVCGMAEAVTLPNAIAEMDAIIYSPTGNQSFHYSSFNPPSNNQLQPMDLIWGDGLLQYSLAPTPYVSVYSNSLIVGSSTLTYYFDIVGPLNIPIPITIQSSTELDVSLNYFINHGSANGQVYLDSQLTSVHQVDLVPLLPPVNNCSFDELIDGVDNPTNFPFIFSSNDLYSGITMSNTVHEIRIEAVAWNGFGTTSFALVDPLITIDPAFLVDNPDYKLNISPGVGNSPSSAVPEPTTMLLFGAGLAGLGVSRRKKK